MPPVEIIQPSSKRAPFQVAHLKTAEDAAGSFTPAAFVVLGRDLLASGLLTMLSPIELQAVIALLVGVTPNGWVRITTNQLAGRLHLSPHQADKRLRRLATQMYHGEPLITLRQEGGRNLWYSATPALIGTGVGRVVRDDPSGHRERPREARVSIRDAVIAHSRATYTHPREAVETEISQRQGWPLPSELPLGRPTIHQPIPAQADNDETASARRSLRGLGVPLDQVEDLLRTFPPERIMRQVSFLPRRHPRLPSKLIVAAIIHDYEEPR